MANSTELENLGSRLATLVQENPDLLDSLDFATGALMCLIEAKRLGFTDRVGPLHAGYQSNLVKRASRMRKGQLPKTGTWLAGLRFNSALLRIGADYHRILRVLTGKDEYVRKLLPLVSQPFSHSNLDKVHKEVNKLKHKEAGLASGRDVAFEEAVLALEELIELVAKNRAKLVYLKTKP